jgi:hypothetical protein
MAVSMGITRDGSHLPGTNLSVLFIVDSYGVGRGSCESGGML